jgi:hypothetical protein
MTHQVELSDDQYKLLVRQADATVEVFRAKLSMAETRAELVRELADQRLVLPTIVDSW